MGNYFLSFFVCLLLGTLLTLEKFLDALLGLLGLNNFRFLGLKLVVN